jgi:signal transduction histidine kinase
MWSLPELEWGVQTWRLPLCERTAAGLALVLLGDPSQSPGQLKSILQADPVLTLWLVCRATRWAHSAPTSWTELANWLGSRITSEFGSLQTTDTQKRERWSRVAERSRRESTTQTENFDPQFLKLAIHWFESAQTGAEFVSSVREAPWFPHWIPAVEVGPEPQDQVSNPMSDAGMAMIGLWLSPAPRDIELSELLPSIIQKFNRLRDLETALRATLEKEKLESLRQLAYGASHEINNPLANIATRAQTLVREESDPERRRKLTTIVSQAFRAHEMISDLMLFAKPPPTQSTTFDVATLVREVRDELSLEAEQQKTEVCLEVSDDLRISADRTQIAVALKALLRNSLEAIVEGGRIEMSAKRETSESGASDILFQVRDNGPGISPETRRHIFDPFFSGREAGRGLGFGLSKCWRIVTAHSGTISVDSEPGRGACFSIRLSAASGENLHRRRDNAHASGTEFHAEAQSPPRIHS